MPELRDSESNLNTRDMQEKALRRTAVALITAFFVADGLLRTFYMHFGGQAVGSSRPFADSLGSETTGALATAIVFFLVVIPVSRRWPLRGDGWARVLPAHVVAILVYSTLKTLTMWALRIPLWPALGLGEYDYGNLVYRFPMEGAGDVIGYILLTAAVHTWDGWRRWKEEEVKNARLESQLTAARLDALRAGLQPHFLFNTLNTIGSLMHEDPETADRMITRLSDLLRRALDSPASELVTVGEEVAFVQEYVDIMLARFADRATVYIDVDTEVKEALVPPFVIQPLVENAFRYGIEPRTTAGAIAISVTGTETALEVRVRDDGPGPPGGAVTSGAGLGLANVSDRLDLLYGPDGTVSLSPRSKGGTVVTLRTPLRFGSPTTRHAEPAS